MTDPVFDGMVPRGLVGMTYPYALGFYWFKPITYRDILQMNRDLRKRVSRFGEPYLGRYPKRRGPNLFGRVVIPDSEYNAIMDEYNHNQDTVFSNEHYGPKRLCYACAKSGTPHTTDPTKALEVLG